MYLLQYHTSNVFFPNPSTVANVLYLFYTIVKKGNIVSYILVTILSIYC